MATTICSCSLKDLYGNWVYFSSSSAICMNPSWIWSPGFPCEGLTMWFLFFRIVVILISNINLIKNNLENDITHLQDV